jgi:hypothetical protein
MVANSIRSSRARAACWLQRTAQSGNLLDSLVSTFPFRIRSHPQSRQTTTFIFPFSVPSPTQTLDLAGHPPSFPTIRPPLTSAVTIRLHRSRRRRHPPAIHHHELRGRSSSCACRFTSIEGEVEGRRPERGFARVDLVGDATSAPLRFITIGGRFACRARHVARAPVVFPASRGKQKRKGPVARVDDTARLTQGPDGHVLLCYSRGFATFFLESLEVTMLSQRSPHFKFRVDLSLHPEIYFTRNQSNQC